MEVDFGDNDDLTYKNVFKHKYIIKIDSGILTRPVIQFPNHPSEDYRQLFSKGYWWVSSLNKTINERLRLSNPSDTFLIDDIRFNNVVGNVYLAWASTVNKQNSNEIDVKLYENTPILFITDGYGVYKYIYVFCDEKIYKETKCICGNPDDEECEAHYFQLHLPARANIFCLEAKKPTKKQTGLKIIYEQESQDIVKSEINEKQILSDSEEEELF